MRKPALPPPSGVLAHVPSPTPWQCPLCDPIILALLSNFTSSPWREGASRTWGKDPPHGPSPCPPPTTVPSSSPEAPTLCMLRMLPGLTPPSSPSASLCWAYATACRYGMRTLHPPPHWGVSLLFPLLPSVSPSCVWDLLCGDGEEPRICCSFLWSSGRMACSGEVGWKCRGLATLLESHSLFLPPMASCLQSSSGVTLPALIWFASLSWIKAADSSCPGQTVVLTHLILLPLILRL